MICSYNFVQLQNLNNEQSVHAEVRGQSFIILGGLQLGADMKTFQKMIWSVGLSGKLLSIVV